MTRDSTARSAPIVAGRRIRVSPQLLMALLALVVLVAWGLVALVHVDDRERIGHGQGVWMALAQHANDGVLYPPLFDGERYGGTRYMPLVVGLHALTARLTGEYLVSGKALAFGASVCLLLLLYIGVRRAGRSASVAALLCAAVVATYAGLFVTTTVGAGDVLPVALQIGAIHLAARGGRNRLLTAGILAGLAPLAKFSAVWGAMAVVTWLVWRRGWSELRTFAAATLATGVVGLAAVMLLSGGRVVDSVFRLATAGGLGLFGVARAPHQVLFNLAEFAPGFLALLPVALVAAVTVGRRPETAVYDFAAGWALLVLLVVFTDIGTGLNQLIDVLVLVALLAAHLPERLEPDGHVLGGRLVALAATCAVLAGISVTVLPAVRTAVDTARFGHPLPVRPLEEPIARGAVVLSEDPYLAVAHDQTPVVLDPFMLRRLDLVDPAAVEVLIQRIDEGDFDLITLVSPLDDDYWWENFHFGPRVADAVAQSYRYNGELDGYDVYRPRR
jgi:hypothetical protein